MAIKRRRRRVSDEQQLLLFRDMERRAGNRLRMREPLTYTDAKQQLFRYLYGGDPRTAPAPVRLEFERMYERSQTNWFSESFLQSNARLAR